MTTKFEAHADLPYLHGKPNANGDLRTINDDFKVFEILPFSPSGEGEHLLIHVEKTGENTHWLAKQLAKFFGVKEMAVTYAGLKDRNAVTQQWFGVHLPGKFVDDLSTLAIPHVKVLSSARHNKKLKTGALIGNRFELTLRNVDNVEDVMTRFQQVINTGVPNYFGEQRFGFNGANLNKALSLFNGQRIKDKKKRSIYLSAARSYLFNQIIAQRIKNKTFLTPVDGDVYMLSGSQSIFKQEEINEDILNRLKSADIDITASMWGRGSLLTTQEAAAIESEVSKENKIIAQGLENQGLKQERRRVRLSMMQPKAKLTNNNTIILSFMLPAGSYATAILREIINYRDVSQGQESRQQDIKEK